MLFSKSDFVSGGKDRGGAVTCLGSQKWGVKLIKSQLKMAVRLISITFCLFLNFWFLHFFTKTYFCNRKIEPCGTQIAIMN